MALLLIYGLALLLAVLVSEWSRRTVLSSAVLFLGAGYLAGPAGMGIVALDTRSPLISSLTDLALFSILFSEGMKVNFGEMRQGWRLPFRALAMAMPATALLIAAAGVGVFGLPWLEALLLGAILSPTDPVFAAAVVGREEIPHRVRHLLNVESGLNDGIALPFVLGLTAAASGASWSGRTLIVEPVGGLALGVGVALLGGIGRRAGIFRVSSRSEPLFPLAIGIIVFAAASMCRLNQYLAAFAAGMTLSTVSIQSRGEFHDIGERLSQLLKLAAVLVIAITVGARDIPELRVFAFAVFVLVIPRTLPLLVVLAGTPLSMPERLVAAWFGPRGFASLLYGLIVLGSAAPNRNLVFQIVTVTVLLSIVLHSSTDVPIARRFAEAPGEPGTAT